MGKNSASLINTSALKEGLRKLVNKIPSPFKKAPQTPEHSLEPTPKPLKTQNVPKPPDKETPKPVTKAPKTVEKTPKPVEKTAKPREKPAKPVEKPPKTLEKPVKPTEKAIKADKPESTKTPEYLRLKFRDVAGTAEEFKALLDANAQKLGPYGTVKFGSKKVVVTMPSKEAQERYLEHYNKREHKGKAMRVSVLDYFSAVKPGYRRLTLLGVPEEYEPDEVNKGLKRRTDLEFRLAREGTAYKLTFKTVADCVKANAVLNNTRVPLVKNKKEQLVKVHTQMEVFGKGTKNSTRVFVRNIAFGTRPEQLRALFSEVDNAAQVHLPANSKGFAFVTFSTLDKCRKALNELNGRKLRGRPIQLALSLPKEIYASRRADDDEEEPTQNGDHDAGDPKDEAKPASADRAQAQPDLTDTVFVRNLDYNCTDAELAEYFAKFGEVASANVCRKEDKTSRGTAFVRFKKREHAQQVGAHKPQVLETERLAVLRDKELGNEKPSVGLGFALRGRRLKVDGALPKDTAKTMREAREAAAATQAAAEKNLHLLMVGVVTEDSPEFRALPEAQQAAAKQALEHKLAKIKRRNTFVNPTRICIKNLPKNVNSNELRTAMYKHLKNALSPNEYLRLKKQGHRGVVDVRMIAGDSFRTDEHGTRVRTKKPFAFVELADHSIAMKLLNFFSNNDTLYSPKRLQCEFTVDTAGAGAGPAAKHKPKKRKTESRGRKQRERRRALKSM